MDRILPELLWVGVLPCATAAAIVACRRFNLRSAVVWAAGLGAAFVVGQFCLAGRNDWSAAIDSLLRPPEAGNWLAWFVLAAVGICVWDDHARRASKYWTTYAALPVWAMGIVLIIALPIRLLAGSIYVTSHWSAIQSLGVYFLWSALLAATWCSLCAGRASGQIRVRGGLLVAVTVGMAATIGLSGSFSLGELCGVAGAALTGALVTDWLLGATGSGATGTASDPTDGLSAAAGVVATTLVGLLLIAYFYASLTATNAALLAVAAAAAGGWLPTSWPCRPLAQAALRMVLCLVPLAIALLLAVAKLQADQTGNPYAS